MERTVNEFTAEEYAEEWDLEALVKQMATLYDTEVTADELREDLGELSTRVARRGLPGGCARLICGEGRGADAGSDA